MNRAEVAKLLARLERARRRLEADASFSPAWAASMGWIEEIKAQLRAPGVDPTSPLIAGSSAA